MNKITKELMVEELGNLITCNSTKKKQRKSLQLYQTVKAANHL